MANKTLENKLEGLLTQAHKCGTNFPEKAISCGEEALGLAQELRDKKNEAAALRFIGIGHYGLSDYESAIESFEKSLRIIEKIGDTNELAKTLNGLGINYFRSCNNEKALECYFRSLKIAEESGNKKMAAGALNNIGNIYMRLRNFEKSVEFYQNAETIALEIGDKITISSSLGNMGIAFKSLNKLGEALECFDKVLKIKEELGDKAGIATVLQNIGDIYSNRHDPAKALEFYTRALDLVTEIGFRTEIAVLLLDIGTIHAELRDYDKAIGFFEKALVVAEEIKDKYLCRDIFENLSKAYRAKEDYKTALEYHELFVNAAVEISHEENSKKIAELRTKYDTEVYRLKTVELGNLVDERTVKLEQILDGIVLTMGTLVETRDSYTAGHQLRVSKLSVAIAEQLGLDKDRIDGIRTASMLHDIGKTYIPEGILAKPSKLSEIEFMLIKEHALKGYEILRTIDFPWPIADIVLQHHERIDGSGYPNGINGDEILQEAKVIAVADVVEAMASHRPYRPSLGIDQALDEIRKNKGISYDSDVVEACIAVFEGGFEF